MTQRRMDMLVAAVWPRLTPSRTILLGQKLLQLVKHWQHQIQRMVRRLRVELDEPLLDPRQADCDADGGGLAQIEADGPQLTRLEQPGQDAEAGRRGEQPIVLGHGTAQNSRVTVTWVEQSVLPIHQV